MSDKPDHAAGDDPPIKITDRRSFHPDGERRTDVAIPDEAAPVQDTPFVIGEPVPASRPNPVPAAENTPTAAVKPEAPAGDTSGGVDFQQFVYFLYMSSLHEMGVPTEPGAPARAPNLDRARFFIDVLQILKTKTAGNLVAGEEKLLEDILYNLQMQYVTASGPPTT